MRSYVGAPLSAADVGIRLKGTRAARAPTRLCHHRPASHQQSAVAATQRDTKLLQCRFDEAPLALATAVAIWQL